MRSLQILGALLLIGTTPVFASTYRVQRYTIDGGSATITGTAFRLSGTIGQPEATVAKLTTADNSLWGGFWIPGFRIPIPCVWDVDGDGQVTPFDSNAVQAQFGCEISNPGPDCDRADIDGDGKVDPFDSNAVLANFGACP